MVKRTLAIVLILTALIGAVYAGAGWKKSERSPKVSLYDLMTEIKNNRQSILVLKEEIRELKARLARVEIRQPAPADKIDKLEIRISWLEKRVDAFSSTLSILWGILAVVAVAVIGLIGFMVYNMRGRKM